jgi:hypothetical protein
MGRYRQALAVKRSQRRSSPSLMAFHLRDAEACPELRKAFLFSLPSSCSSSSRIRGSSMQGRKRQAFGEDRPRSSHRTRRGLLGRSVCVVCQLREAHMGTAALGCPIERKLDGFPCQSQKLRPRPAISPVQLSPLPQFPAKPPAADPLPRRCYSARRRCAGSRRFSPRPGVR